MNTLTIGNHAMITAQIRMLIRKLSVLFVWFAAAAALLLFQGMISLANAGPDTASSSQPGESTSSAPEPVPAPPDQPTTVAPSTPGQPAPGGAAPDTGTKMKPDTPAPGAPTSP